MALGSLQLRAGRMNVDRRTRSASGEVLRFAVVVLFPTAGVDTQDQGWVQDRRCVVDSRHRSFEAPGVHVESRAQSMSAGYLCGSEVSGVASAVLVQK